MYNATNEEMENLYKDIRNTMEQTSKIILIGEFNVTTKA